MHDIAIVGAGELGGTLAHLVARRDVVRTIHLIDDAGSIAAGKALDITQAAPIERVSTRVSGSADLASAASATVLILADRAGGGEWEGEEGLSRLRRIAQLAEGAVIVCSGAAQRELVERGVRELHLPRRRLFGSAPEALAAALRALVALEIDGSPRDVALTVLGVPPSHLVVPWEHATIGGFAATAVLDQFARRRIGARVAPLWPPGPFALAAAGVATLQALLGRSRRALAAFVAPDDSGGRKTRAAALPVRLGPGGIIRVENPPLTPHDRVALDNAMLL